VDGEDLCFLGGFPGPLSEVAGIWAEELDTLPPERVNTFDYADQTYVCREYFELTHLKTARSLGEYQGDFYAGMPAVTKNEYGLGRCYYIAARTGVDFLTALYRDAAQEAGVRPVFAGLPAGVGATLRVGDNGREYRFIMNYLPRENRVLVEKKQRDLLTGQSVVGEVTLPPRGVLVLTEE